MATWSAPFELRKLVVSWQRQVGGGVTEDAAKMTFHLLKLTGGAPDANWTSANYAAAEARFATWWGVAKADYLPYIVLGEYRWFKSGPVWEPKDAPNLVNPADRVTPVSVAGTSAAANSLPPQIALTLTEKTQERKRWGRAYMPPPSSIYCNTVGRVPSTSPAILVGRLVTMYNGWRTDGFKPVVWSRGRGAHVTSHGTSVPDHDATAYEVLSLQMDDILDVMRSRRYTTPTVRASTDLT